MAYATNLLLNDNIRRKVCFESRLQTTQTVRVYVGLWMDNIRRTERTDKHLNEAPSTKMKTDRPTFWATLNERMRDVVADTERLRGA